MVIQLKVRDPKGDEKIIDLCNDTLQMKNLTVEQVKKQIKSKLDIGDEIRLVFGAETLEESSLLVVYGVRHLSTIHCLLILPGGL